MDFRRQAVALALQPTCGIEIARSWRVRMGEGIVWVKWDECSRLPDAEIQWHTLRGAKLALSHMRRRGSEDVQWRSHSGPISEPATGGDKGGRATVRKR